ncbi:MAG: GNAT family N-acetyltransferase [Granulosicoccus sp.]
MTDIKTRTADGEDVRSLLSWAEMEGWNPGIDDAHAFHAADQQGFFVACVNDDPVAGISLVKQNPRQAFLGLYLCLPQYRGRGLGLAVWEQALGYAGDCAIGLDGVPEQQENYQRSGFVYQHRTIRYAGQLPEATGQQLTTHSRQYQAAEFDAIVSLDAETGGVLRETFYRSWLCASATRHSFVYEEHEEITGFITIRRCVSGFKIGPLLAKNTRCARELIARAASVAGPESVSIDVPEVNGAGIELAQQLQLLPVFETARMYKGAIPTMQPNAVFGVATLELG